MIFLAIFLISLIILSQVYKEEILSLGNGILVKYHKSHLYMILFLLSAVSSTLIPLPVWIYVFTSVALGFSYVECAVMVGLGSALGSTSSYVLGRCSHHSSFFVKRIDKEKIEKWRQHSQLWIGAALFCGTVSPVHMDLFYAAAGLIRFPSFFFLSLVTSARVIRYILIGYFFFVIKAG